MMDTRNDGGELRTATMARPEWREPATMEEALALRDVAVADKQAIEAQLARRDRNDADGNRLDSHTYWQWRGKAMHALNMVNARIARIKAWIKENNRHRDHNRSNRRWHLLTLAAAAIRDCQQRAPLSPDAAAALAAVDAELAGASDDAQSEVRG